MYKYGAVSFFMIFAVSAQQEIQLNILLSLTFDFVHKLDRAIVQSLAVVPSKAIVSSTPTPALGQQKHEAAPGADDCKTEYERIKDLNPQNPYDAAKILDVALSASNKDFQKAYHHKSLKYHPDKAGSDNKALANKIFQSINAAYQTLNIDQKTLEKLTQEWLFKEQEQAKKAAQDAALWQTFAEASEPYASFGLKLEELIMLDECGIETFRQKRQSVLDVINSKFKPGTTDRAHYLQKWHDNGKIIYEELRTLSWNLTSIKMGHEQKVKKLLARLLTANDADSFFELPSDLSSFTVQSRHQILKNAKKYLEDLIKYFPSVRVQELTKKVNKFYSEALKKYE